MTKSDAYEHFLNPMRSVLSPPFAMTEDAEKTALEQYADALKEFGAADLATGWTRVRNANKRGRWPPIGLCIEACTAAARERREAAPARASELGKGRTCTGEEQDWPGACMCLRCVSARARSTGAGLKEINP